jgi:hypothetical protein
MSVDYDRQTCEKYVQLLVETLSPGEFKTMWLAMSEPEFPCTYEFVRDHDVVWVQWLRFSRWNKQGILYMMVPHVEKYAKEAAYRMSQEARKHEPL